MTFRILTVGWEPYFINELLSPIEKKAGVSFVHGLVGEGSRVVYAEQLYSQTRFI